MTAQFGELRFDRTLDAPPARVFEALTHPADRMAWGPPDTGHVVEIDPDAPPPAAGLREHARCGPRDTPYVDVTTDWVLMEPPGLLVYVETLAAEGQTLGTSLATFEVTADGAGTALRVTVQVVSFVGDEMLGEVEGGWTHALDNLVQHLRAH
ncbi:SRPBCC family protein [Sulfitobacter sp. S190]|uniref:SRPBCC family protein n=1 Tax=Sulfitobacter sp. S190 TaxID=2867022 RepID=UPI0021A44E17|nr:SRPBCC domain-containing protein [Sulfitobacter sp. S190]UWR21088.1 SRPBCC domain-containing protein [Sulfitobacter sp. S190]